MKKICYLKVTNLPLFPEGYILLYAVLIDHRDALVQRPWG